VEPAIVFDFAETEIYFMKATGELIRLMNYVDDITTTLRRITANITSMTDDERKRLADYMRKADERFQQTIESVEQTK
jgi:hypothetical protein